jgi:hypothetical protein
MAKRSQQASAAVPATPGPRILEMFPLSLRADVVSKTIDDESRTVELIFSTGAPVERYDWRTDTRYLETLSLDPENVRIDRLNDGGPLLDTHSFWSVSDQLGAVVPGSVTLAKKEARARVRFSRRASVEPIWQDVRDGIIRSVSVGYRVYRFEETAGNGNQLPVRRAVDWEPYEVSMVPIPADAGAKVRENRSAEINPCEIVAVRSEVDKEKTMGPKQPSEFVAERSVAAQDAANHPADPPEPSEPNERDTGVAQERARVEGIRLACEAGRMTRAFEAKLIADGTPLLEAQALVFKELKRRDPDVPRGNDRPDRDVRVGDDPFIHVRAGIENAILHRIYPKPSPDAKIGFELTEEGRPYRGMTLLDIARAYLNARGIRTTSLSKMELASMALGLDVRAGAMHSTSDFANLLADVTGKTLRQAYAEAPQTFTPISRRVTLPDFKPAKRLQIGEAPALIEVKEHGEFTRGTIGEGKEQFQLATYGRTFAITRKSLVNDDTQAFSRVPMLFGRAARNLESDLVWAQITSNPNMGDAVALFHANHGNLAGAGAAITVDTIGAGRTAMRNQKGVDGATLLNIFPLFLIVPAAKETVADQFVSQNLLAGEAAKINPFAGRLTVIAEPRLDANSVTAWYLASDPGQIDTIEYAYLEGEDGPMVESRIGFDVDGLEVKCRHDFAAKVIDWRGFYKNPGA